MSAATTPESTPGAKPAADPSWIDGVYHRAPAIPTLIYWGLHASCLLAFVVGVSTLDLVLLAVTFWVRMFAITAGYHRYFSHRTYRTSRAFQFVLAVLGCTATQKGPLWWAGLHRIHHRFSDTDRDVHPPRKGFWYAHQGWIMDPRWERTPVEAIPDFARYPELVWLNKWHFVPPAALAAAVLAIGGFSGLLWGFAISTVLLWHATYTINSLSHRFGSQRYDTGDESRNNLWLALLTMGEGWHNNHHHYMASTRQGFFWWEIDLSYYILRALAAVGLVWDLREPPAHVLRSDRVGQTPRSRAA